MLKEELSCWEYLSILLFIPGMILTMLFSSKENRRLNQEDFNATFYTPVPMIYLGVNLFLCLILTVLWYYSFIISPESHIINDKNEEENIKMLESEIYSDDNQKEDKFERVSNNNNEVNKRNKSQIKKEQFKISKLYLYKSFYYVKFSSQRCAKNY